MKKMVMSVLGMLLAMVASSSAAVDLTALGTEITGTATAVSAVVSTGIIAGFGVFALVWGARKIKGGLSAGA